MSFGSDEHAWKKRDFAVAVAGLVFAVAFSGWSAWRSWQNDKTQAEIRTEQDKFQVRQDEFQRAVEERQASPILAAGVEPESRGKKIKVFTEGRRVEAKRAEQVFFEDPSLLIVPVRNIGEGRAVIVGLKDLALVDSCRSVATTTFPEPRAVEERGRVGYYNIAPGEAQQLVFRPNRATRAAAAQARRLGFAKRLEAKHLRIALRYSGGQQDRVRWTCMKYLGLDYKVRNRKVRYRWALEDVSYDDCTEVECDVEVTTE